MARIIDPSKIININQKMLRVSEMTPQNEHSQLVKDSNYFKSKFFKTANHIVDNVILRGPQNQTKEINYLGIMTPEKKLVQEAMKGVQANQLINDIGMVLTHIKWMCTQAELSTKERKALIKNFTTYI
jgi:hypothetical protein